MGGGEPADLPWRAEGGHRAPPPRPHPARRGVPPPAPLLVERFRDELGDWRLVVHSPFGAQVNAPWALVLAARLRERYGVDVASMHSDDGIVLRLPDTTGEPPEADLAVLDPDDVEREVT